MAKLVQCARSGTFNPDIIKPARIAITVCLNKAGSVCFKTSSTCVRPQSETNNCLVHHGVSIYDGSDRAVNSISWEGLRVAVAQHRISIKLVASAACRERMKIELVEGQLKRWKICVFPLRNMSPFACPYIQLKLKWRR
jgi:hypothetical protein